NNGETAIIDQGSKVIAGFTDEILNDMGYYPAIIFGDHTRIIKYIDFPFFTGADGTKVLNVIDSNYDLKYLYYYLRHITIPNNGYSRHFKFLKEVLFPVPELGLQNKIVATLDTASDLIEKRKQQLVEMDNLIQSTFIEMFGDPSKNEKTWEIKKIKEVVKKTQYGSSSKASESVAEFPILRMNNITYSGEMNYSNLKYIDLSEREKEKYLVYKGELLFNRTNSRELVGKTGLFELDSPMAFAGYLIKIIPSDEIDPKFMLCYMNSSYIKQRLLNMAKSIVGMANINAKELGEIPIPVPPIELQNEFTSIVEEIEVQKKLMEESLIEMENCFNALMQKAFKGELFPK
ncbi:hypothetical protein A5798_002871, partial [Enterococcus sp. 6C8_DIV0013]